MKSDLAMKPDAHGLRVAVVVSRYHEAVTSALESGARTAFLAAGGRDQDLLVASAPGAFELPAIAAAFARRPDVAAVVILGCIVEGKTRHDRVLGDAIAAAAAQLSVSAGKPVGFGVLTVRNAKQARERAGGKHGNKGQEAMDAALLAHRAIEGAKS